jgi:chorismate mutase
MLPAASSKGLGDTEAPGTLMTAEPSLEDLRRDIDRIDEQIHDLLMARAAIGERIRDAKSGSAVNLRPGREAMILRRLVTRHRGAFPKPSLVRIWREIFSGLTRLQGPFSMAVLGNEQQRAFTDLARDQFGSYTPMSVHQSAHRVIETVVRGDASVGILPLPRQDDEDPWWPHLVSENATAPRIVARLPFAGPPNLKDRDREALVISRLQPDSTDDDRTALAIDAVGPISIARLTPALEAAKLRPSFTARWQNPQVAHSALHLVEVGGFVAADDPRVTAALETLGVQINRTIMVGAYAMPLGPEALRQNGDAATASRKAG